MKIVILCSSLDFTDGGPPRVVFGTAKALANAGHKVDIMSLCSSEDKAVVIENYFKKNITGDVRLYLYLTTKPMKLGYSRAMHNDFEKRFRSCDVVHFHGVWEVCFSIAAIYARRNKIPYFVSTHGMLDRWSMQQSRAKKFMSLTMLGTKNFLLHATSIVVGSNSEINNCALEIHKNKFAIIPNGVSPSEIDINKINYNLGFVERFPHITSWKTKVLFYSRIHPKKGIDILVEAFQQCAQNKNIGLLIVGIKQDIEYEKKLRSIIANSSVSEQIILTTDFTGEIARSVFHYCDIFVLPSHQEGFSMSVIEAMSLQKPILVTDKCNMDQVAISWNCGLVVTDDVTGIRHGLTRLMNMGENERQELGRNGRETVREHFSWESIANKLIKLYNAHQPGANDV